MHYKNGREARNGDTVIGKPQHGISVVVGIIQDINPGCTSCNCTVLRPGGLVQSCVTVGDLFHADDAFECTDAEWAKSKAAMDNGPIVGGDTTAGDMAK